MPIAVRCPKCGHGYQLRDELAGKKAKCRCGQSLAIPVANSLTSLLDEEQIGLLPDELGGIMPPGGTPAMPTAGVHSSPQFGAGFAKKRKKKGGKNPAVIIAAAAGGAALLIVVLLLLFVLTGSSQTPVVATVAHAPKTPAPAVSLPGQATPQETFESYKKAWVAGDWARVYALMTPETQNQMTAILAATGAGLGPVCPELAAVATRNGVQPVSLAAFGGMPQADADPFADNKPKAAAKPDPTAMLSGTIGAAAAIKDKKAFFVEAMPLFVKFLNSDKFSGISAMGSQFSGVSISAAFDMLPIVGAATTLSGLRSSGSTADAFAQTPPADVPGSKEKLTPLHFNQLSGSWYLGTRL